MRIKDLVPGEKYVTTRGGRTVTFVELRKFDGHNEAAVTYEDSGHTIVIPGRLIKESLADRELRSEAYNRVVAERKAKRDLAESAKRDILNITGVNLGTFPEWGHQTDLRVEGARLVELADWLRAAKANWLDLREQGVIK